MLPNKLRLLFLILNINCGVGTRRVAQLFSSSSKWIKLSSFYPSVKEDCLFLIRKRASESIRERGLLPQSFSHRAGQRDLRVATEARDGGKAKTL